MIDNFAILLSTGVIVFVIYRAMRISRTQPWFEAIPKDELNRVMTRRFGPRRDLRAEVEATAAARARDQAAKEAATAEAAPPRPWRRIKR